MAGLSPSPRYKFQRPDDRAGVGPLTVYRSLGMGNHPQVQEPHFHVRRTISAYGALEPLLENGGNPPAAAAHLNSNGFADVDKAEVRGQPPRRGVPAGALSGHQASRRLTFARRSSRFSRSITDVCGLA